MSLLSNSLFLDSEYKADCEYKINYLSLIESNNRSNDTTDLKDDEKDNDKITKTTSELLKQLETKVIISESDEKPYADDGTRLYNTKQIADEYYKILIEQ